MESTMEDTVKLLRENCALHAKSRNSLVSVQAADIVAVIDYLRDLAEPNAKQPAAKPSKES